MAQHWLWLYVVDADRLGQEFEPVVADDPAGDPWLVDPFEDTEALTRACARLATAQAQIFLRHDPRSTPRLAQLLDEQDDAPGLPPAAPEHSWLGARSAARTARLLAEFRALRGEASGLTPEELEQVIKFLEIADGAGSGFVVFFFD